MTKIKEIIKANSLNVSSGMSGHFELTPEQLDTAASAIEKVHDEEMVGFAEWIGWQGYIKGGGSYWSKRKGSNTYTTSELLTLYKHDMSKKK